MVGIVWVRLGRKWVVDGYRVTFPVTELAEIPLPFRVSRNGSLEGCAFNPSRPLIINKKEGLIASMIKVRDVNGTAHGKSKLVHLELWNGLARPGVEIIVRVQRGVTQEL